LWHEINRNEIKKSEGVVVSGSRQEKLLRLYITPEL